MIDHRDLLQHAKTIAIELGKEIALREAAEQRAERIQFSGSDVVELIDAIASDRKIDAIKLYRQMTGYGLKESKDAIERVTNRFSAANAA